jgi:hypothetical protein
VASAHRDGVWICNQCITQMAQTLGRGARRKSIVAGLRGLVSTQRDATIGTDLAMNDPAHPVYLVMDERRRWHSWTQDAAPRSRLGSNAIVTDDTAAPAARVGAEILPCAKSSYSL